MSQVVFERC